MIRWHRQREFATLVVGRLTLCWLRTWPRPRPNDTPWRVCGRRRAGLWLFRMGHLVVTWGPL